ncbi:MAG: 4Fe-4S binding protein [Phycisphaerales bacterium]|nr:MAG: 4Fe-4S binding protein [Phycisphaerales bacterium]
MRETRAKGGNKMHWARRLSQVFFMFLLGEFAFYGVFRCPFAVPYVSCGNCPVTQCPGRKWWIPIWAGILLSGLVLGRVFCGWACPAGFVSDVLGQAAPLRRKLAGSVDRILSMGKYVVLVAAVGVFVVLSNPRWAIPIRTGEFFRSVKLTFEHADSLWIGRTAFVLVAIGSGVVLSHFWCRYLCATGGILEILNKIAIFKYHRTANCNDCDECHEVCPVETRPAETNCNNCGDCARVCPTGAIKLGRTDGASARSRE